MTDITVPTPKSFLITSVGDEGVALIAFNRPEKRNALSKVLIEELVQTIADYQDNDAVRVLVLTGCPNGPFSAGADLSELVNLSTADAHKTQYLKNLCDAFGRSKKPIIAAVVGFALGGGFEMAMMCDMIFAADNAVFGLPELKIGTMPGAGGTQRLTRALGKFKAMELILTGSTITGEELSKFGLVSQVLPAADVLTTALNCAHKIASHSTPVVQGARQSILNAEQTVLDAGLNHEKTLYYSTFSFEDRTEGMAAFLEKRKAVFKHR